MRVLALLLPLTLGCAAGLGDPCALNAPCPAELRCHFTTPDGGQGFCDVAPREFGETCTAATDCAEGLTCSNHFTAGERYGSCVHQRAAGQPCYADVDCQSGDCAGATRGGLDGVCSPL